jgi:hypothetical protein
MVWLALAACSSPHADSCPEATAALRQPIRGGSSQASYLALSPADQAAIVSLEAEVGFGRAQLCSGVLVGPDVVLTARHCLEGVELSTLHVRFGVSLNFRRAGVSAESPHPDLDLTLLRLTAEEVSSGTRDGPSPLPLASPMGSSMAGRRVTLAGYGEAESGSGGELMFAVGTVRGVNDTVISTEGLGASGACEGDSGGPLLAREAGGIVVLGLLTSGSPSCTGVDHFVRTDKLSAWLEAEGVKPPTASSCGAIGFEGRCFDGTAVWCEESRLASEVCLPGEGCGWDATRRAFRCLPVGTGCTGADQFGACQGDVATYCGPGALNDSECGPCQRCAFDPITGRAGCF